jgi:hypothetical protein
LERYEVSDRAASGIFFIFMRFSWDWQYRGFEAADPGIGAVWRIFRAF